MVTTTSSGTGSTKFLCVIIPILHHHHVHPYTTTGDEQRIEFYLSLFLYGKWSNTIKWVKRQFEQTNHNVLHILPLYKDFSSTTDVFSCSTYVAYILRTLEGFHLDWKIVLTRYEVQSPSNWSPGFDLFRAHPNLLLSEYSWYITANINLSSYQKYVT